MLRRFPTKPDVDQFLQQAMTDGAVPGMALAVISDGKESLAKGYGVTGDGTTSTEFDLGQKPHCRRAGRR